MHEALRRSLPKRLLRRLGRHPVVVVTTVNLALKAGRETYRWRSGIIDAPELRRRLGGHVGTMGGSLAGAAAGSAAGTAFAPGLGTVLGAFCGGLIGENLGGRAGRTVVEKVEGTLAAAPVVEPQSAGPEDASSLDDSASDSTRRTL